MTAITRTKLSSPTRFLENNGLLVGRVLDYGCGKGNDADELEFAKFDPYFFPKLPSGKFDTIVCNYVLNTLPDYEDRINLLVGILNKLKKKGKAYITVRTDVKNLNGYTKRGTWQGLVELTNPIVTETSFYRTYLFQHIKS